MQTIAGVLCEADLFRRYIEDIICISPSQTSDELARQALTSYVSHSGLKLTFCLACAAEKKRVEWNFWTVNHCITTENDFGFVTRTL